MSDQESSEDPDLRLVLACQAAPEAGFEGPFRDLYEAYRDRVYSTCYRITGNATDALDAAQETFALVHRRIGGFRRESRLSSWIYRIAVNASIDLKRRAASRPWTSLEALRADPDQGLDPEDDALPEPSRALGRGELARDVHAAIGRLSDKLRVVVVLRYLQEQSYEEVSETLGISLGTVKSRLSRAHEALDRELAGRLDRHYTD